MDFKGIQKFSLIDYPGKLSCVVFTGGCNFRCPFCQNKDLVLWPEKLKSISFDYVLKCLEEKRGWVDGLVLLGGEPTIHEDLTEVAEEVKNRGFLVKLDTNGSNPNMLRRMIKAKLVDYVAMDVKAPLNFEHYSKAIGVTNKKYFNNVLKSIKLLKASRIDYEFRTTVVPKILTLDDVKVIARQIRPAKAYYLQQFSPHNTLDKSFEKVKPYPLTQLEELRAWIDEKKWFKKTGLRT